jgi:hypothetical protein
MKSSIKQVEERAVSREMPENAGLNSGGTLYYPYSGTEKPPN